MLELKLRLPLRWPSRENGAWLPAFFCIALICVMGVQLLTLSAPDLPLSDVQYRTPFKLLPAITFGSGAAPQVGPSLFAPTRVVAAAANEQTVAAGPLDGTYVTGAIRVGALHRVYLRDESGHVLKIAPGQTYRGWRLLEIRADSARFSKGGKAIAINFGLSPASSRGDVSTSEDNQ